MALRVTDPSPVSRPIRSSLRAEAVDYLTGGNSVSFVGLPGSGRTTCVRGVMDALAQEGWSVVWLSGIAALRDRPFTALALAGVGVDTSSANGGLTVVRATEGLEKMLSRRKSVLVVDDADELDLASAGVILAVRSRRPFPMVIVSAPGRRPSGPASALAIAAQPGVQLPMAPLRVDGVHRLMQSLVRGSAEPCLVARIATMSGGLPSLVRALVQNGLRNGSIVRRDGMWCLDGEIWDERLAHVVLPLLVGVKKPELETLRWLAAKGTVRSLDVRGVVKQGRLARLVERGLVAETHDGTAALTVFPPLLGDYLRGNWSTMQAALSLVDTGLVLPVSGSSGSTSDAEPSAQARRVAEHWQTELVRRRESWSERPVPHTAVPLIIALHATSADADEIRHVQRATARDVSEPAAQAELTAWAAAYLAIGSGDLPSAIAELSQERLRLPEYDGILRAWEGHLTFLCREVPPPLTAAAPQDLMGKEAIDGVAIESLVAGGQTDDALQALTKYVPSTPLVASHAEYCRGLARVLGGDIKGGVAWATQRLDEAMGVGDLGTVEACAYVAAVGMTLSGSLRELDGLVDRVLRLEGTSMLHRHFQAGVFTLVAIVAGWEGRLDYARGLADQASAFHVPDGPFPGMLESVSAFLSRTTNATILWDTVDDRLSHGYLLAALFAAVPAVERGQVERATAVVERGRTAQSQVARALANYVAAVANSDPEALRECISELREACGPVYAMRAGISRAIALREQGDIRGSAQQAEASWREGGGLGSVCPGLFTRIADAVSLTSRERQVLELITQGHTTVQAAEHMEIAKRTVETHMHSLYRKIGTRSRAQLSRALATWLNLDSTDEG